MQITCATSTEPESELAAVDVCKEVASGLDGGTVDLATLFVSRHHLEAAGDVADRVVEELGPDHLIGCTAESIVGGPTEYEDRPAVALWAGHLPGAGIETAHVRFHSAEEADGGTLLGLPEMTDGAAGCLLCADPFTFPPDLFIEAVAEKRPGLGVMGGLASAARRPGQNRLFLDGEVLSEGAACVVLSGDVGLRPVVSQGCRPIGTSLVVTRSRDNFILEIGGESAVEKLSDQLSTLGPDERRLLRKGLHVGIAIDASKSEHVRGDFLVRNVLGIDRNEGAIAVGERVRPGRTIQFHVRDADSASEDLHHLLRESRSDGRQARGALLFTCNGRGSRLFEVDSHDAGALREEVGEIPVAGFFAAGEIGPVGGENFLHGFTASVALFEE